jgi:hypothetical protein
MGGLSLAASVPGRNPETPSTTRESGPSNAASSSSPERASLNSMLKATTSAPARCR